MKCTSRALAGGQQSCHIIFHERLGALDIGMRGIERATNIKPIDQRRRPFGDALRSLAVTERL